MKRNWIPIRMYEVNLHGMKVQRRPAVTDGRYVYIALHALPKWLRGRFAQSEEDARRCLLRDCAKNAYEARQDVRYWEARGASLHRRKEPVR